MYVYVIIVCGITLANDSRVYLFSVHFISFIVFWAHRDGIPSTVSLDSRCILFQQ